MISPGSMVTPHAKVYDAPLMGIAKTDITGLILAGGRGSRMGGVDKGLQKFLGQPLAQHALQRLAPQVGRIMLNANRNLSEYRSMGVPVWPDEVQDYPGPLAGMWAGLAHCETSYLVTVPCDTPNFPLDLVEQLTRGLVATDADMATACTREGARVFPQPVFCLMKTSLLDSLRAFVKSGQRKTGLWAREHHSAQVVFEDDAGFVNINTLIELDQLQKGT
jgi:molybdopterin-guanine dinucleotide biosynthesis protein A